MPSRNMLKVDILESYYHVYARGHEGRSLTTALSNHFHLLIYQTEEGSMSRLMQGIMTSYRYVFQYLESLALDYLLFLKSSRV